MLTAYIAGEGSWTDRKSERASARGACVSGRGGSVSARSEGDGAGAGDRGMPDGVLQTPASMYVRCSTPHQCPRG